MPMRAETGQVAAVGAICHQSRECQVSGVNTVLKLPLIVGLCLFSSGAFAADLPQCSGDPARYVPGVLPSIGTAEIKLPAVGAEADVEVGQSMINSIRADIHAEAIVLAKDIDYTGADGGNNFRIHIPAGKIVAESNDTNLVYYISPTGSFFQGNSNKPTGNIQVGVSVPIENTAGAKVFWLRQATFFKGSQVKQFSDPNIIISRTTCIKYGQDSFKRELVYSGFSHGTISILYREYLHDMARPAFSQDLTYDISTDKEIGYRGARFQIIKASNTGIRYKILRPLD